MASGILLLSSGVAFAAELTFISPSAFSTNDTTEAVILPLNISGTASDDAGVASVSISILDTRTSKWWGENGWSDAWAGTNASLSATSSTDANWDITFNLQDDPTGSGNYLFIAGMNDGTGVYHADEQWQRYFSVQNESIESGIQYTSPAANQAVSLPLNIQGSVTSPTGIAEVSLSIMDMSNYKWWNAETKRWDQAWSGDKATLTPVDAYKANWNYAFDPSGALGSGRYRILTSFSDAAWSYQATTWKQDFIGFDSDTAEQGITFTYPGREQSVTLPMTIKGTAAADNGVAEVSLSIIDLETYKWWNNGSWSDSWTGHKADLSSRSGNLVNWQYTFNADQAPGSGKYRVLTGMSDLNWQYLTDAVWALDFNKKNTDPVEQVSPGVYQLVDLVEYDWLVGCVPTAASMMIGYWDRNGYGGLITGDSTRHSQAIDDLIFSPGHVSDYLQPTDIVESFDDEHGIIKDKSESIPTHKDNSLADYISASQSRINLDYGWSWISAAATGIHGWANQRGYGGFRSSFHQYSHFSYDSFRQEILAGRPAMISVDVQGKGNTDHLVLGVAFNDNTKQVGVLNGWDPSDPENPPELNWIDWKGLAVDRHWGIGHIITVTPPDTTNVAGPNTIFLDNSGGSTSKAYYRDGILSTEGDLNILKQSTLSNLGSSTIGIASSNGHRFWQLVNDGSGTAALYESESRGEGGFSWVRLSSNSGLNRSYTEGLATADGETFWQLWNDNSGTMALVRWNWDSTKRYFTNNRVMRYDTGLPRANTLGAAMKQDGTLLVYVKTGSNQASLYSLDVTNNNSTPRLLRSNVPGMDSLIDFSSFKRAATVASDGDGADSNIAVRPSELHQRLAARGNQLDNWGAASDPMSDNFGGGNTVVPQPLSNSDADSPDNTSSENAAPELNQSNGGSGGTDPLYLLLGVLAYTIKRRWGLARK